MKIFKKIAISLAVFLSLASIADAQVFRLNQISSSTQAVPYWGVLMGDGNMFDWATASSGPTFDHITATSTNASSTIQHLSSSQFSITGASGCAQFNAGGFITGTGSNCSSATTYTGSFPINVSGTIISFNGLSTSTNPTVGHLGYFSSPNTFADVATSSIGAGTGISFSGTSGSQVGGTAGTYSVNTIQNITTLSNLSTAGTLNNTSGGVLYSTATSSFSVASPLTLTGTAGALVGGTALTVNCPTCSTFSYPFPLVNGIGTSTGLDLFGTSTIGAGTQTTGLTISGGATTTGTEEMMGGAFLPQGQSFESEGQIQNLSGFNSGNVYINDNLQVNNKLLLLSGGAVSWDNDTDQLTEVTGGLNLSGGNLGIGTTSPYAKLSVVGPIVGAYYTGTTTATSTLAGDVNARNLAASSQSAGCAQFGAGGFISSTGSNCGSGGSSFAYPFPAFSGTGTTSPLFLSASTTIGDGTALDGLTVYGNGTTTGNSLVQGTLSVANAATFASPTSTLTSDLLFGGGTDHTIEGANSGNIGKTIIIEGWDGSSQTTATGGNLVLQGGAGGNGVGNGGSFTLTGGATTNGTSGLVAISTGASPTSAGGSTGKITLTTGSGVGSIGQINLTGGHYQGFSPINGGLISINGGPSDSGVGGGINLTAGAGTSTNPGANVTLTAGSNLLGSNNGGSVMITGGVGGAAGASTVLGGSIMLNSGIGSTTGYIFLSNNRGRVAIGTSTSPVDSIFTIATSSPHIYLFDTLAGANAKGFQIANEGGNMYIGSTTDGYATSSPAALTILNDGDVGIGTSSPWGELSLGSLRSSGEPVLAMVTSNTGDDTPSLYVDGSPNSANADFALNRGSNVGQEANIDFDTASVPKWQMGLQNNSTDDFELWNGSNNPTFTINQATSNVGVATTTAWARLSVGSSNATTLFPLFAVASSSSAVSTSTLFIVNSNGNVGVGTSSPLATLSIQSPSQVGTNPEFNVASSTGAPSFTVFGNKEIGIGNVRGIIADPANFNWFFGDCGTLTASGQFNTCLGRNALNSIAGGASNMAIGLGSLNSDTSGGQNVGVGVNTISSNVSGGSNVAIGDSSGLGVVSNSYSDDTLIGASSGKGLSTGSNNTFIGYQAASTTSTGGNNISIGINTKLPIITGSNQLNIGNLIYGTGINGNYDTLSTGNIGIGTSSPTAVLSTVAASSTVSSTAYQGLVSIIAGFENTTVKLFQEIDQWGDLITQGDAPTLGSCGVGAAVSSGSNQRTGAITIGTGVITTCPVLFAHAYPAGTTVHVFLNQDTGTLLTSDAQSITTSGFTINSTASLSGDVISYIVQASQ